MSVAIVTELVVTVSVALVVASVAVVAVSGVVK